MRSIVRVERRLRWKRWLGRIHRSAWLIVLAFFTCFAAEALTGMSTLAMRVLSGFFLALTAALLLIDLLAAWLGRLDRVGIAQMIEKRCPALAERLVTMVQTRQDAPFASLLQTETEQVLAAVDPAAACPLERERKAWTRSAAILVALVAGFTFVPGFGSFAQRFFGAWGAPLVPFEIEVQSNYYALRGGACSIEASVRILDDRAEIPSTLELRFEDKPDGTVTMGQSLSELSFAATLTDVRRPLRCRIESGRVVSNAFEVGIVDAPVFASRPTMTVRGPAYMANEGVRTVDFDANVDVVQHSRLTFRLPLDQRPVHATLRVRKMNPTNGGNTAAVSTPVAWQDEPPIGAVEIRPISAGLFEADLVMELEHGLSATLPIGKWTVHEDRAPRFTQALRFAGGGPTLLSEREYPVTPDDVLKLQTVVEDDEGLAQIQFEYRINGGAARLEKWLDGAGKKKLIIDNWLPLPATLKETDRVQFRVHATDNRNLKKGEILRAPELVPAADLLPQVTIAPADSGAQGDWIALRIDRSAENFVKQQAQKQAAEIRDVIAKIKQKLQRESDEVQQVQRAIHRQPALTLAQRKQADQMRALNLEIAEDLLAAGQRFGAVPELAKLASHFLEIAETDMMKSHEALDRFSAKDRPLPEAEKELPVVLDALAQARKKLERMLDWNKLLAQDRLDQFQLEQLLKRQHDLAERLEKLLAEQPMSDADMAKEIEAIRAEQARLAEQTAQMETQARFGPDAKEAEQAMAAQKLADQAQQLAKEMQAMADAQPAKLAADIQKRLDDLATRQLALANRVRPVAQKHQGPDVKPAERAADALKKPNVGEAIGQQKEHETRLKEWQGNLLPGGAANALREQVLQLAKKQKDVHRDLARLGDEFTQLSPEVLQQRIRDLTARQKGIHAGIEKLLIDPKNDRVRQAHQGVAQTAQRAGDQLAERDTLGAFESMEKAHRELEALAGLLPKNLPVERKDIKDAGVRERVDQVDAFLRDQEKLRAETERLQADFLKAGGGGAGKHPLGEKAQKLTSDLMELAQKGGPEAKVTAKEAAQAADVAKKSMDSSQAAKAKGNAEEAKMLDAAAEKQLEFAFKQMKKLAEDRAPKMVKPGIAPTADALKEGQAQMRVAEKQLPTTPKEAKGAMQSALRSLTQAAHDSARRSASKVPQAAGGTPGADAAMARKLARSLPKDFKLEAFTAKSWGELPGQLKTEMMQDARARFGEEYAEMIRQYFDRLAETPAAPTKE